MNSTDIQISSHQNRGIAFSTDQADLIKRTIAVGATDDELKLFMYQCSRTGLDPLAKQIYFQKYNTKDGPKVTIIVSIDGYRLQADRTGRCAGSDDPVFEQNGDDPFPTKATVTVYKLVGGQVCAFAASARWSEYYPGDGPRGQMWRKMPHTMLGKCAEALALRKAFPAELSGIYAREEMEQAEPIEHAETTETKTTETQSTQTKVFDGSVAMTDAIRKCLGSRGIPDALWRAIENDMLHKPFTISKLEEIIKAVMDRSNNTNGAEYVL